VSPGAVDTPGLSALLASSETGQQRLKMISNTVPLGRLGTPNEIAKAVVFLASDDSSYITGTELFVDGVSHKYRPLIEEGHGIHNRSSAPHILEQGNMKALQISKHGLPAEVVEPVDIPEPDAPEANGLLVAVNDGS
jgi:enoyl-ACP reductase-like protein